MSDESESCGYDRDIGRLASERASSWNKREIGVSGPTVETAETGMAVLRLGCIELPVTVPLLTGKGGLGAPGGPLGSSKPELVN
jgi:hypothetical protein